MSRNAFVPMEWLTAPIGGEALRTLIAISFFADSQTGECWPTNAKLQAILGKTERNIQKDIKQIVQAGLISIRDGQGKNRRFRIESPEWFDRPRRKTRHETDANPVEKRHHSTPSKSDGVQESTPSKNDTLTPSKSDGVTPSQNDGVPIRTHPINTPIEHSSSDGGVSEESKPPETATTTITKNLEPFEPGNPAPLPAVRNAVEPFRPKLVELKPTNFGPNTRNRILSVLGQDGEQFARKVTQEQADAGFVDWVLDQAKGNRTPARLAFHLLKTSWREGWVSPKAEEEAKRAARRARLEALQ